MLPLILVMWHFANLISLARSGQHARLDCECVRVPACVHEWVCLWLSGPVEATTLADGSTRRFEKETKHTKEEIENMYVS